MKRILAALPRVVLFVFGLALAVWGQRVLVDSTLAPSFDSRWVIFARPLQFLLADTLLHWTALALTAFAAGCISMAVAIGLAPRDRSGSPTPALPPARRPLFSVRGAVPFAALALLPIGWSTPYRGLATWLAGLIAFLVVAWRADRNRGTRFGPLFAGRSEWLSVALLFAAAMAWLAHDLRDWRWSGIPDESRFFEVAKNIAAGKSNMFFLSEKGVFGYHPVLCSQYQALFMRLLGVDVFGWRFSSAFALAISLPFLYLLGRDLVGRRAGYVAAVLLATTPLAVGFAHLGYDNIHVLPILCASLALVAASARRRSVMGCFLAGCIAGLGWFTYYPARIVLLLAVALGRMIGLLPVRRGDRATTLALFGGFAVVVLPLLLRLDRIVFHMFKQTYFGAEGVDAAPPGAWNLVRFAGQWMLSLLYGVWARESHMQMNPMLDPITATASVVGLCLAAVALARERRVGFLALAYVVSALLVGGFSQYDTPPITRLLFLMPFSALLAAFALENGLHRIDSRSPSLRGATSLLAAATVAVAAIAGAADIRHQTHVRFHGYGDGTTSELLRVVATLPSDTAVIYVQRDDTYMADAELIAAEYGWGERISYFRPFSWRAEAGLAKASAPLAVFLELNGAEPQRFVEKFVKHRFPGAEWVDTDGGNPWSLRWLYVPNTREYREETPDFAPICD